MGSTYTQSGSRFSGSWIYRKAQLGAGPYLVGAGSHTQAPPSSRSAPVAQGQGFLYQLQLRQRWEEGTGLTGVLPGAVLSSVAGWHGPLLGAHSAAAAAAMAVSE